MNTVPMRLSSGDLEQAAAAVTAGQLVAVPTPRWYMLCAAAGDAAACSAIFTAKQRPSAKPLLLVIADPADAARLFTLSGAARALIGQLWPGELALHLPWRAAGVRAAYPAIGDPALLQCPAGVLGRLAELAGPLAAASLSVSTPATAADEWPALTAGEAEAFIAATGAPVAAIIDDGICPYGTHLTVVDCPADIPGGGLDVQITRHGSVHPRAITAALTPSAQPRTGQEQPHVG
ncbi:L-threonylcarbamoyladenylate synthase [Nonomuraea sp. NPDC004702]